MALVKDKTAPPDVPSTDALRDLEDPDNPRPAPKADLYLSGAVVGSFENPPAMGARLFLVCEVEVTEVGVKSTDGGDTITQVRKVRRVGDMWREGAERPVPPPKKKTKKEQDAELEKAAADNQPPLYDDEDADGEDQGIDE